MARAKRIARKSDSIFLKRFIELIGETAKQEEVANKIGISRQNVGSILSGATMPNCDTLMKITRAYNVSADWLLGINDTRSPSISIDTVKKVTGLSENAVVTLTEMNNQGSLSVWIKTLSYLLENDDFITLISLISEKISIEDKEILIKDHGLSTSAKTIDVLDFKISSQIKSITDTLRETVPEEDKHAGNLNSKIKTALNKGGERRT